jgi:hypothetical protein
LERDMTPPDLLMVGDVWFRDALADELEDAGSVSSENRGIGIVPTKTRSKLSHVSTI